MGSMEQCLAQLKEGLILVSLPWHINIEDDLSQEEKEVLNSFDLRNVDFYSEGKKIKGQHHLWDWYPAQGNKNDQLIQAHREYVKVKKGST